MTKYHAIDSTVHIVGPSGVGKTSYFSALIHGLSGKRKLLEMSEQAARATDDLTLRHSPESTKIDMEESSLIGNGNTTVRLVCYSGEMARKTAAAQEAEKRFLEKIAPGDVVAVVINPFCLDPEIASFALRFYTAYFQTRDPKLTIVEAVKLASRHLFHWLDGNPEKKEGAEKPSSESFPEFEQMNNEFGGYALSLDESEYAGDSPFKLVDIDSQKEDNVDSRLGEKLRKLLDRLADTAVAEKNIETKNILATLQKSASGQETGPIFIMTHVDLLDRMVQYASCDLRPRVREVLEMATENHIEILFAPSVETVDNVDDKKKPYLQLIGPSKETGTVFWVALHHAFVLRRHEIKIATMERKLVSPALPLVLLGVFGLFYLLTAQVIGWTENYIFDEPPYYLATIFGVVLTVVVYTTAAKNYVRYKNTKR